jgi:hypothetical protein
MLAISAVDFRSGMTCSPSYACVYADVHMHLVSVSVCTVDFSCLFEMCGYFAAAPATGGYSVCTYIFMFTSTEKPLPTCATATSRQLLLPSHASESHPVLGGYKYGDLALQVGGSSKIGKIKYGLLSSKRVLHGNNCAIVKQKTKIWSLVPDGSPTPRQNGRLIVGLNLT